MITPLYHIDAFVTDTPFSGNPAAVCLLARPAEPAWMQHVAAQMNLSETAFVVPAADGFDLRWFTPALEVDLCGHATLAAAHALWESGTLPSDQVARFHTRSGLLTAERQGERIELVFPGTPVTPAAAPAGLAEALGTEALFVGQTAFDLLVEVVSPSVVRALKPDFAALGHIPVRGVIVTSAGTAGADFVSRFFAPAAGVAEDPVTGSAHCALALYWRERLGRESFVAHQLSRRGGHLAVRVDGDRVRLAGRTRTVLCGELLV